jgi:hypothetical protein
MRAIRLSKLLTAFLSISHFLDQLWTHSQKLFSIPFYPFQQIQQRVANVEIWQPLSEDQHL